MTSKIDNYIQFIFTSQWDNDMLIALLTIFPFNSFEESEEGVIAYLPESIVTEVFLTEMKDFSEKYEIKMRMQNFENRNWNNEWESNYKPVSIDDFCIIRADFHDIDTKDFKHVITVNPEMTFGTGHHETTSMMIRLMSEINFDGSIVVDFGSGTGILAILSEKMGASDILAIDNDPVSVKNIIDNSDKNTCSKIKSVLAETLQTKHFSKDIVLANIERNVISTEVENISNALHTGGLLLISGILIKDKDLIIDIYENHSFKHMKTIEDGEWAAMKFIAY